MDREEVAAAVAAESSTGTWTTVWTDLLTDLDYYKGRAYRIEDVPGDDTCFYAFVAYPIDLFEEGSVVNVLTSLVGNVFGFKALRAPAPGRRALPDRPTSKTCGGPPHGIQVERDMMNKYGRPLLGCTIKPKLGLSGKNYGPAPCTSACAVAWTSPRTTRTSTRSPSCAGASVSTSCRRPSRRPSARPASARANYLNVTAPTPEEMYKRAEYAKELGSPIIMHDYLTGGLTANTRPGQLVPATTACCCTSTAPCTPCSIATHTTASTSRVLTKVLRLSGGDHLHSGTVVGKLEGDRASTLGWIDIMRDEFIKEDRSRGIFFDQDFGSMPGVMPVASGGIHVWHMPALVNIFGDDSVLQFRRRHAGPPLGQTPPRRRGQPRGAGSLRQGTQRRRGGGERRQGRAERGRQTLARTQDRHGNLERDQVRVRHSGQARHRPQVNRSISIHDFVAKPCRAFSTVCGFASRPESNLTGSDAAPIF